MKTSKKMSRRNFVKASAMTATVAGVTNPFNILKAGESPNNKLNVAFIGINGMGAYILGTCKHTSSKDINFVRFCDVEDRRYRSPGHKPWIIGRNGGMYSAELATVPVTKDYRVLFDKYEKDFDAVVITTPDFSHYALGMTAMSYGKHVYIQKPLTNRVATTRELMKKAQETGVVTQMGNQGRSKLGPQILKQWYDEGILGDIVEVHMPRAGSKTPVVFDNQPVQVVEPLPGQEIPKTFDWNLWNNVATPVPYNEKYHPHWWRHTRRYGSGGAGDWGCHQLDAAFNALKLDYPISILAESKGDGATTEIYGGSKVTWEFQSTLQKSKTKFYWYQGCPGNMPVPKVLEGTGEKLSGTSTQNIIIVGTKNTATLGVYGKCPRIIPYTKMRDLRPSMKADKTIYTDKHHLNFFKACKGEMKATSPFDYAGKLAETVLLGNVAGMKPGEKIMWDAEKMSTGDAELDLWLDIQNQRDGWIK